MTIEPQLLFPGKNNKNLKTAIINSYSVLFFIVVDLTGFWHSTDLIFAMS